MKPDSIEAAEALLNKLKSRIMSMKGMHQFINVMGEDGRGYVVALVESKETSDANLETVRAIWGEFADMLAEPPKPAGFHVLMNETRA
ncbi:hypothetical protein [Maritimibacter sp. 55A14]|uniref:hypothetical protein n=1 Tax=Maritimibacter sp. 55A14 TaxID=2174844 RepID=UPI001E28FA2A|nr:hypothetical protein [Maritimibacter sp. 55A14]